MKIMERNNSVMNRPGRVCFDRSGPLFALSLSLSLKLSIFTVTKTALAVFCQGCFLSFAGHNSNQ